MIESYKLQFKFCPESLKADLDKISQDEWVPHFNKGYYDGDWSGVVLCAPSGKTNTLHIAPDSPAESTGTPILERCLYFQKVIATFRCPVRATRLLRLSAGSVIKEHRDYDLGYETGEIRIHIPVLTNAGVEFHLNNRRIVLAEGEVWYLDLNRPHRVANFGHLPRIHLVLDLQLNDWLCEQIPFNSQVNHEPSPVNVDPGTAARDLARFREFVCATPELQLELCEISDLRLFAEETVRIGAEHGFDFRLTDVEEAIRAERRSWIERWVA
jgi:hypothetical protein